MGSPTFLPIEPPAPGQTNTILVMGRRVALDDDIQVVTYADDNAPSFYRKPTDSGEVPFGSRTRVKDAAGLKDAIRQVILHTDLTVDSAGCFGALMQRGLSTHFMIDWDGTLYQPLDVGDCAYHAGDNNQQSIGIDLNNLMSNLEREPKAPMYPPGHARFAEMSRDEYRRPRSDAKRINTARVVAYGYTDAQYRTLVALLKTLTEQFPNLPPSYPVDARGELVDRTLDDPMGFQGFAGHFHVEPQRWDPGPGFDWERVRGALANERNSFPIELEKGKNIGDLLDPVKVMAQAQRYFANNEGTTHGWFPVGANRTWHGGIHLAVKSGSDVRAMTDGVLVAARFGSRATRLGHNNFVLLRHAVELGKKKPGVAPKTLVFYSLYMHLAPMDLEARDASAPQWLRDLAAGAPHDESYHAPTPDDDDAVDARAWLELGDDYSALKRGEIAKIAWRENPVFVKSGALLGRSGRFGEPAEEQIHVELFAEPGWREAVDMGIHGKWLTELDDDVGHDLEVEDRALLALFDGSPTLDDFWRDADTALERAWLRKVVARHVSEWSDQVDWVMALSKAEGWDDKVRDFKHLIGGSVIGKEIITRVLPFVWLSKDMAAHIGLDTRDWRGQLDHFHPIHFLMWLTFKAGERDLVASRGRSDAAILAAIAANPDEDGGEGAGSSVAGVLDGAGPDGAVELRDGLGPRDGNEWKRDD